MDEQRVDRETQNKYIGIFRNLSRQIFTGICYKERKYTLFIFCIFGLAGVLPDLDHFIVSQIGMGRGLHLPLFFAIWIVSIYYYTHTDRRFHKYSVGVKK